MDGQKPARQRTSGIDRSLQVMDILSERMAPLTAYELAKAAGAPASTIYRLIDELVERGMLTRAQGGRIWLGPRVMRYGLAYRARMNAYAEAEREMHELSRRTGEMVQICARDEGSMAVIGMAEGEGHFRVTSDVGTRVPLNWTASGRLLLGHLPDDERIAAFAACAQPSETGLAETDPAKLGRESRADYEAGLSVQINTSENEVACIAAPVRDETGACILTLSVVMPKHRVERRLSEIETEVRAAAANVERAMGVHRPG